MMKSLLCGSLFVVLCLPACKKHTYSLDDNGPFQAPEAHLAFEPQRGITIDRQYHTVPDPSYILPSEIALIKQMGFGFVKLIANPEVHKMGAKAINMIQIDRMVNLVMDQGLPVVLTIHPEPEFKYAAFGSEAEFDNVLKWYEDFARYVAAHWPPDKLAFQLMTEPFGDSPDPTAWNYWNKLQPRMWAAVRRGMPKHTLILSGSSVGTVEGVTRTEPVDDANVMYAFSHYEPFVFTLQGAYWPGFQDTYMNFIRHVPYPSSTDIIATRLPDILQNVPEPLKPEATAALQLYGTQKWDKQKLGERMQMVVDWNKLHGGKMKLFAGEFGVLLQTVTPADRYAFLKDFRQTFEEKGIDWSYWSFNETFTVLKNGNPDPEMLDALLDK